jgi:pilus assembly protein CpaB
MRRSPRVVLAWTGAAIVALLTARMVGTDLASLHRRAQRLGPDVPVVLAARDLPLGTTIAASDLRVVHRPASTVANDALRDPNAATGRVVSVALVRDDVVRAPHLAARGRGLDGAVTAGRRALHVVAKDGYRPPPGSVVDVYAAFDPATVPVGGASGRARTVATGARVLADDTAHDASSGDPGTQGVTLLVTEAEAQSVAFAAALGQVTFALAPPETACCASSAS